MRTLKISCVILIVMLIGHSSLFAQGFQPPAEGKSVVYFVRVSGYGGGASFEFFHQDKYIGVFKKKNYMRYECDPGEQLLWASSENKEFITSNLKAGETYIVIVDVIMGFWKAHVGLTPISVSDTESFDRSKELINKKEPIVTPEEKIEQMNKKLEDFIAEELKHYDEVAKHKKNFKHISPDMAIPAEAMK
ncbi:MAG: hypothetical protein K8R74_04410 [Bacteroidales bacterium]|nr:hypothetical protein [Bacteroidales bacterium]